ncbi:LOW QUALITY PROTEIN: uncharacterized protein LOC144645082 [Oculina patagonica]
MDDSDSGGLMSTEEEQSGESSGSTGHLRMEKKISKLKMKLKGFEQAVQERDTLRQEVQGLECQIEELIKEKEQLNAEHAQELVVLSSSFSEHLNQASDSQDTDDPSFLKLKAEFEKEIQKLRTTIGDKNYHIGNLQKKLLEAQLELENELDKHEEETERLRARLENGETDFEKLIEERIDEVRSQYEKELEELRARIENNEESTGGEGSDESNDGESRRKYIKENADLKTKLQSQNGDLENLLEEERTKYRVEIMAVKDRLTHQHQVELDDMISQLEKSNAEVEELKEKLRQEKVKEATSSKGDHSASVNSRVQNGEVENGGEQADGSANVKSVIVLSQGGEGDTSGMEALRTELNAHYQQQIEQVAKRLSEEYQGELDESLGKMEEEWEQQLERQRNEYEEKIAALQRQLKSQYQNDLDQVTADMEDQIQALRDSHSQEVAELLGKLRELSEERRRSVIQQDTTEQQVVIIKEESRSKIENLEQQLRVEKDKVVEYQRQMDAVEAQVQAFKAEKQQELKMIEEEMRRQCKALVEKKSNELKERYQSELNEKLNKTEQHWRKLYEEDIGKTRSELEESNKTLKDKYERQVSDIMVQMDEVQQRSREVLMQEKMQFEAEQKEQFEKQLSEVKEELQPYKDKCLELEKENQSLSEKYERDLSELKSKMNEVEGRYKEDKGIEEQYLTTLKGELELYKNKLQELQEGKKSLMENYEAQLANLKKKYDEMEDGEIKTLQEEVNVYIKKAASLEEEKRALLEKYETELNGLKTTIGTLTAEVESRKADMENLEAEKDKLSSTISELTQDLESARNAYSELEQKKQGVDNKLIEELEGKIAELEKDLEDSRHNCHELQEAKRASDNKHSEEMECLRSKLEAGSNEAQSRDEQLLSLTKEKERLQEEVNKIQNELKASEEKFERLEEAKKISDEQHETDVESLMSELNILRNLSAEVEQLRKLEKQKENYELEVSKLKEEMDSLTAKIRELEEVNSSSSQEIAALQKEVEMARGAQDINSVDFEEERRRYQAEVESLRALTEEQKITIQELEDEGQNKFGVLLSQHEKELESLKEELEEQIAKKREQLSKESSAKRQKLKDEYEGKLRLLYEELVAEKTRIKDLMKLNDDLSRKLSSSQEESNVLTEEIDRLKDIEEAFTGMEEQMAKEHAAKLEQVVAEYEEKVRSLEEKISNLEIGQEAKDKTDGENEKEREQSLQEYKEKVESLEIELATTKQEAVRLQEELEKLEEKSEVDITKLVATYEEKLKKSDEEVQDLSTRLEEREKEHQQSVLSIGTEKEALKQQLGNASGENEKLQTMVKNLDAAKQAVVHMYDEKIEVLVSELEEASERASSAEEHLKESGQKFAAKQEKLEKEVTELRDENKRLVEEHDSSIHSLERTLSTEVESKEALQQRVADLLEQLSSERVNLEGKLDEVYADRQRLVDAFEEKKKVLEDELLSEKNERATAEQTLEETKQVLNNHVTKLQELDSAVLEKESTITAHEETIKEVSGELGLEKDKASRLEKEIRALMENQSSEYVHNLERIRNDLKQEYEETTEQLKKNYENIFTKMEEEHRISREEIEAEVESLKGMVENLEQLNQLKDEEHEVLMTEQASKHEAQLEVLETSFEKKKVDLETKVDTANKALEEVKTERHSLVEKHKIDLTELESKLLEQHQTQLKNATEEVKIVKQEKEELKEEYEKEIETLKDQLIFESAFQADLQNQHDKEIRSQKESLESEHKKQIELINQTLQEQIQQLETTRSENETEIGELKFKLEESQIELDMFKENFTSQHDAELKNLQAQLQDKIQECENLKEQMGVEVVQLSSRVEELSAATEPFQKGEETESVKLGYEVMLASLRVENNELNDQVQSLKEEMGRTVNAHQQEMDFTKNELERQFKQREDRINKKHSEEFGKLMEKLEDLVQQQNASKTRTEEHMQDIGSLRAEFDHKFQRLLREKQDEMEQHKRSLEQQYQAKLLESEELIKKKDLEIKDLQRDIKTLLDRIDACKGEALSHQKGLNKATEELSKLRRENSELYRKLREQIEKSRGTSFGAGQKTIEQLQMENERLKRENENLKNLMNRSPFMANGVGESETFSEGSHVLQLIKLMEQLMKEKNTLELKLRQEILDLKTKFGVLGDTSRTSINNTSVMSVSLSPEKHFSRDGLVEMLQELRENKLKQEEDIKSHAQETENMISEIKKMLDSAEFTDHRLQEMLRSQLDHLEQQRRVLVQRLWQLREKHKAVEEKLSRQLAGISSPQNSSNSDSARSKCYESIIEENLRREKELLALKRQQVEDLNARITREKLALERHSKEKQTLEKELKEKDKLESELSTQRRDLERKWIGRLKEKEIQLMREKEILDESKRRDEVDNILLRGPSPRPTDRNAFGDARPNLKFPITSQTKTQEEPFKREIDKPVDNRAYLPGSYGRPTNSGIKDSTTFQQHSDYSLRGGKQTSDRTATSETRELWRHKKSKRSPSKKKDQSGTNRVEVHVPRLDLSSDSDVDLGIANNSNSWEIDLDDDDSDLELYSTQSMEGLDNFEEDWGRRLEEELKQISVSGAVLLGSDSTDVQKRHFQQQQSAGGFYNEGIKKSKLITLDQAPSSPYSSKVDFDTSWLRKLSYEYTHPRANHPRTSTANGKRERTEPFDLADISRITSEIASLPKDAPSRHILRDQEMNLKQRDQDNTVRGSRTSQYVVDSLFPLHRNPSKESGIDSPSSARSEPAISGTAAASARRRSLRNERISGVYLLNVDEYVDRHMVRSSEEVAKIRDLSPSEKRFDL